jgi:hypothetical protein
MNAFGIGVVDHTLVLAHVAGFEQRLRTGIGSEALRSPKASRTNARSITSICSALPSNFPCPPLIVSPAG